jgi:predicted kinase
VSADVYRELLRRAGDVMRHGQSVIIDSVAARPAERDSMVRLAKELGVEFSGIWLDVAKATMLRRVAGRGKDASDATTDVVERQLAYDLGNMTWHRIDANGAHREVVDAARDYLQATTCGPAGDITPSQNRAVRPNS